MAAKFPGSVERWLDTLSDKRKAEVAGFILSGVDPDIDNLTAFWSQLGETVQAELSARIEGDEFPSE